MVNPRARRLRTGLAPLCAALVIGCDLTTPGLEATEQHPDSGIDAAAGSGPADGANGGTQTDSGAHCVAGTPCDAGPCVIGETSCVGDVATCVKKGDVTPGTEC